MIGRSPLNVHGSGRPHGTKNRTWPGYARDTPDATQFFQHFSWYVSSAIVCSYSFLLARLHAMNIFGVLEA